MVRTKEDYGGIRRDRDHQVLPGGTGRLDENGQSQCLKPGTPGAGPSFPLTPLKEKDILLTDGISRFELIN